MENEAKKEASTVLSETQANVVGGGEDCFHPAEEQPPANPIVQALQQVWNDLVP